MVMMTEGLSNRLLMVMMTDIFSQFVSSSNGHVMVSEFSYRMLTILQTVRFSNMLLTVIITDFLKAVNDHSYRVISADNNVCRSNQVMFTVTDWQDGPLLPWQSFFLHPGNSGDHSPTSGRIRSTDVFPCVSIEVPYNCPITFVRQYADRTCASAAIW